MPLVLRQYIAHGVRGHTAKVVKNKPPEIIDVSQDSVINEIRKHDVTTLIHGHTHRPNVHKLQINQKDIKRIVLGDWYDRSFILEFSKDKITIDKQSLS